MDAIETLINNKLLQQQTSEILEMSPDFKKHIFQVIQQIIEYEKAKKLELIQ
ncbi:hypothetical protein D3C75_1369550 [compost metagenome]